MASVNDFGGSNQPLSLPPLGGPDGWAAAVAKALDNKDETVDARAAKRVAKTGDTMTGALILPGNPATALGATPKQYVEARAARMIGGAVATANQLNFGATPSQIAGFSTTFQVPPGHLLRVTMKVQWFQRNASGHLYQEVREGGSSYGLSTMYVTSGTYVPHFMSTILALNAGTHTFVGWAWVSSGAADAQATSNAPNYLLIEDLGADPPVN